MDALPLAVVIGSTRPGRRGAADRVRASAADRPDVKAEILDVGAFGLPVLDEPLPAASGQYAPPATRAWAAAVATFEGWTEDDRFAPHERRGGELDQVLDQVVRRGGALRTLR